MSRTPGSYEAGSLRTRIYEVLEREARPMFCCEIARTLREPPKRVSRALWSGVDDGRFRKARDRSGKMIYATPDGGIPEPVVKSRQWWEV